MNKPVSMHVLAQVPSRTMPLRMQVLLQVVRAPEHEELAALERSRLRTRPCQDNSAQCRRVRRSMERFRADLR
eukprot:9157343-Heterocapsa_arctica.AAC.1